MKSVLIRCDGWPQIGFGHVVRCLALADELHESQRCDVAFAMIEETAGSRMVQAKGYRVLAVSQADLTRDYAGWLKRAMEEVKAKVLVLDIRDNLPIQALQNLKDSGAVIATIDDPSDRRLFCDLAFYPPVPQVRSIDWSGFSGRLYVGWQWVILRRGFSDSVRETKAGKSPFPAEGGSDGPRVLVTMGGSDPAGLTLKAVIALDMLDGNFQTSVLLGPGFLHGKDLSCIISNSRRKFHLLSGVKDIPELMSQADFAVGSFGVTAYELAAIGVPGIFMCLTDDHVKSAMAFVEAGMGECVGRHDLVSPEVLSLAVGRLIGDLSKLEAMSEACRKNVDGLGARRVAEEILRCMGDKYVSCLV
jgi:spore coat polysaccharide biosynthesis protein SpsF